jgi:hypothetical protein
MRRATAAVTLAVMSACSVQSPTLGPGATTTASHVAPPTAAASGAAVRVDPTTANLGLAARAREHGRTEVMLCLFVDPSTGSDAGAALMSLQTSVNVLVRQGYTVLGGRPVALCPHAPLFIRTNTVHPKNNGGGGAVAAAPRAAAPSPYQLWVALTTAGRIDTIFGGFTSHRGTEEISCTGDNCGSMTESIYTDPSTFARPGDLENVVLEGFGLLQTR